MSKIDNMDQIEDQKEALFNLIDNLRDAFDIDLEDMDLDNIKEWGRPLIIAGASAFVIYKVMNGLFGGRNVELDDDRAVLKNFKVKEGSVISRFVKEQAVIILLSLVRKWIKKYLRAKSIIDED